jgi:drug/metabolite transporter (DMT)-like permease
MEKIGYAIVITLLAAFFGWVLVEMADANDALVRLARLAGATVGIALGAGLVYAALKPLGDKRRSSAPH